MSVKFGRRQYIGDAVIVAVLLSMCLIPLLFSWRGGKSAKAEVCCGGKTAAVLDLSHDTEMSPDGGHTVICVSEGRAFIKHSDCPDGVCMEMRGVDSEGGYAICVPNNVSILPYGGDSELDAVAG